MAVLVVDDDATVVNLVTAVLHRSGIDAEVALDGPGALQRLGRRRYRAVLSDLTMPGMSGLQLLREARARGHDLPFLIMTAYLPPETESALRSEPGVAGVLRKPFDIKRLVAEVRSLLESAGPDVRVAEVAEVADVAEVAASVEVVEVVEVVAPDVAAEVATAVTAGLEEAATAQVSVDSAAGLAAEVPLAVLEARVVASAEIAGMTTAREPVVVSALLPLSLMEFVTARLRRQALIAQAERRAAALRALPASLLRATGVPREAGPLREAEQGC